MKNQSRVREKGANSTQKIESSYHFEVNQKAIDTVNSFLQKFFPKTLSLRIICVILLAFGIPNGLVINATGVSERTVRQRKKNIDEENFEHIFKVQAVEEKAH
jgi:ABC-type antimicrobial peptide transport system permease subunit